MKATQQPARLVCGLDDSEHASTVMNVAAELAARLGLRLCLVHSVDPDLFLAGERRRTLLSGGAALLDDLVPPGTPHDRVVALGEPARLLAAVLENGAELAVVGSRGRGPARAAAFGSTSSAVVHRASCPVVVVPPHSAVSVNCGPAAVVCGVDGSPGAAAALAIAHELARRLGSELVAVHVEGAAVPMTGSSMTAGAWPTTAWEEARHAAREMVQRAIDQLDTELLVRMRFDIGDPAEQLSVAAAEQPSALLVVGSRGHSPLRSALCGSVSSRLCASAPVPVVVVPHASHGMPRSTRRSPAASAAS
jgi:nucleotide-binding universal stress UspA family protein